MKLVIEPGQVGKNYWADLWRYHELLFFLAWRDILVRYKQTVIGVAWAVLRPLLTMAVFLAFRRLANIQQGEVPEPLLVFAAVLPWQFFSTALSDSSASMIGNSNLISKVYFPRLIIPTAAVVTAFVDFVITLLILGLLMAWYGFAPDVRILALPLFVLLVFVFSVGLGVFFAALNVEYRDFRYVVPFIIQFGIFISPIAFATSDVPAKWRTLYGLNPMVGIMDGFRWSILRGVPPLDPDIVIVSVVGTVGLCLLGLWYFRRMERSFADVI